MVACACLWTQRGGQAPCGGFRVADCHHGNRPGFTEAALPEEANKLYEAFVEYCRKDLNMPVETGSFGADMQITLTNDGPVTIMLECQNGKIL